MSRPSRDDQSNYDDVFGNNEFDSSQSDSTQSDHNHRDYENDLLGYVLGALDERETQQIDELIRDHPDLEDELQLIRMSIAPLEELNQQSNGKLTPPIGLARRACESVASYRSANEANSNSVRSRRTTDFASTKKSNVRMSEPEAGYRIHRSSISQRDLIATVLCVIALVAIAFPMIASNRFKARVAQCQNNLTQAGMALLRYADQNSGKYVTIPTNVNLAVAGYYAPTLLEQGLVDDPNIFFCSGKTIDRDQIRAIPSYEQVINASGAELIQYQRNMSGDFGFTMGHTVDGKYVTPKRQSRPNFVLLADSPSSDFAGRGSANHNGYGQNCFFEDGHIGFIRNNSVAGDAIYENDLGQIAPGAHELDSVVAPSHARLSF